MNPKPQRKPLHPDIPATKQDAGDLKIYAWRQARRVYVAFPSDSSLTVKTKDLGMRWDPEKRACWIGSGRADEVTEIVLKSLFPPPQEQFALEQERIKTLLEAARENPLFVKDNGDWVVWGTDLTAGQVLDVRTRQGHDRCVLLLTVVPHPDDSDVLCASFASYEEERRRQAMICAAMQAPLFHHYEGLWRVLGVDLQDGEETTIRTRSGENRRVVLSNVRPYPPAPELQIADFWAWKPPGEPEIVWDFQPDSWGTPRPEVILDEGRFVKIKPRPWRAVIEAQTDRWYDPKNGWGDRTCWVLADPTPTQDIALKVYFSSEKAQFARMVRAQEIFDHIVRKDAHYDPNDNIFLSEPRLCGEANTTGAGEWFVLDPKRKCIWAVRDNGRNGDCWARNNITIDGAGAIGWRIAYNESLAAEIRDLHDKGAWLYQDTFQPRW